MIYGKSFLKKNIKTIEEILYYVRLINLNTCEKNASYSSGIFAFRQAFWTSSGQRLACTSPTWALRRK